MKQFAIAAVAMSVACGGGTPDVTATPAGSGSTTVTPDAAAVAAVVVDAAPAAPSIDGAIAHTPMCGRPWRSVVTSLHALVADATSATICANADTTDCAKLDFASGAFTNVGEPIVAAVPLPHWEDPAKLKLDIPPADAAKIAEASFGYDVSADGKLAIAVLPDENTVGVFDVATGKRTRTLKVTTNDAKCVAPAFWIGDVVYASARTCDDLDMYSKHAYLFVGDKRVPAKALLFGAETRLPLANGQWAVVSLKPYRLDVIDGKTGVVSRSVALPQLERQDGNLALGLSPFGTTPLDTSPVVVSGDALVVVSSRAIARIPPTGAPKVWPFAACK